MTLFGQKIPHQNFDGPLKVKPACWCGEELLSIGFENVTHSIINKPQTDNKYGVF
jgi:hypothetical protein